MLARVLAAFILIWSHTAAAAVLQTNQTQAPAPSGQQTQVESAACCPLCALSSDGCQCGCGELAPSDKIPEAPNQDDLLQAPNQTAVPSSGSTGFIPIGISDRHNARPCSDANRARPDTRRFLALIGRWDN